VLIDRLVKALEGAATTQSEVLITAAIESYVEFIEEDPDLYGFLINQAPLGGPAMISAIDRIAGSIERVICETLALYNLDSRPARTWAHGVVGMVHLAGAKWAREPDIPRDQLVADLSALIARGMRGAAEPLGVS
jgi:AcrR family transcriptional regulator